MCRWNSAVQSVQLEKPSIASPPPPLHPMLNYNEDKMPSQLKQNKPSDVSKTLCIWKKEKEITGD